MTDTNYFNFDDTVIICGPDDREYEAHCVGEFSYFMDSGSMYRSNGDPGDPPYEELECDAFKIDDVKVADDEGDQIPVTDEHIIKELEELFYDEVYDWINSHMEDYIDG